MFLMKTYGDIIGIYHYGDENPFKLLNITVASLPEKDITALNEGIKLYSKEELYSLIEDFDG